MDGLEAIIEGSVDQVPSPGSTDVKIYLVSVGSEFMWERRRVWEDTLPELQMHFMGRGLDVQLVDLQQGHGTDAAYHSHTLAAMMDDMGKCHRNAVGPFVVFFVGDNVGPISLPVFLDNPVFEALRNEAFESGKDVKLLDSWYLPDLCRDPPGYRLKEVESQYRDYTYRGPGELSRHVADTTAWLEDHERLVEIVQQATHDTAPRAMGHLCVTGVERLVNELTVLCPENCVVVHRELTADGKGKKIGKRKKNKKGDTKAERFLDVMDKLNSSVDKNNTLKHCVKCKEPNIDPLTNSNHAEYLQLLHEDLMDILRIQISIKVEKPCSNITPLHCDNQTNLHREILPHVVRFRSILKNSPKHVGDVMKNAWSLCEQGLKGVHNPVLLCGPTGIGKTSLLCRLSKDLLQVCVSRTVFVVRFLTISQHCTSGQSLMVSICSQIMCALGDNPVISDWSNNGLLSLYKSLIDRTAKNNISLVIAVDDLDLIYNKVSDDFIWLMMELPKHVHVLLTATKDMNNKKYTSVLEKALPSISEMILPQLSNDNIIALLEAETRTNHFSTKLLNIARSCPRPLFGKMILENAIQLQQFQTSCENIEDIIRMRIEHIEDCFGKVMTQSVLRYLNCFPRGVTEVELLDLLSSNNSVILSAVPLDDTKLLRIPYTTWIRIRNALGYLIHYIVMNNKSLVRFSHHVISKVVAQMYQTRTDEIRQSHTDVSELYLDTWVREKQLDLPEGSQPIVDDESCRFVCQQPILYSESRYNLRRINEMQHHLLRAGNIDLLKDHSWCNFEHLLSLVHGVGLSALQDDLSLTCQHVLDADIELVRTCVLQATDVLARDPLQLASVLIGRLRKIKDQFARFLEPLIQQAMDWCDSYTLPLLVPLSSWLPDPRVPLLTTVTVQCAIERVSISKSGQHVFCTTTYNEVLMYHLASQKLIKTFSGQTKSLTCLVLTQDGQHLMTGSLDGSIYVWNIATGRIKDIIREPKCQPTSLSLSRAEDVLVVGTKEGAVNILHVMSCQLQLTAREHKAEVTCVQLSACQNILVTGSRDKTIIAWYFEDMTILYTINELASHVVTLALSANNSFLIFACEDGNIRVGSLTTGTLHHQLKEHKGKVRSLRVSSDCTHCVAGCSDGRVYTYNLCNTSLLETFTASGPVTNVDISTDEHFICSASKDTVQVWTFFKRVNNNDNLNDTSHTKPVTCLAISTDGKTGITGSADGQVKLWSLEISDFLTTLSGHEAPVTCVALADNDQFAVSGSEDRTVKVWSVIMSCVITDYKEHNEAILAVYPLRDKDRILSADAGHVLRLWRAEDGDTILTLQGHTQILSLAPSTQIGICGDNKDQSMRLWNVDNGTVIQTITHAARITCVVFSSDSQYVATGSADLSLKIWEAETGKLTQVLVEHEQLISCAVMTDDNKHVISGSHDRRLLVWSLGTGLVEHQLNGHTDAVTCVKVTADGTLAISGSHDGTLLVWDIYHGTLVTLFDVHVAVRDLHMTSYAGQIVLLLEQRAQTPFLCLHNTTAGEVKSQSQISIQLRGDSPCLPVRPRPLLQPSHTSHYAVPRKRVYTGRDLTSSTVPDIIKAPMQSTLKAQAKKRSEAKTKKSKETKENCEKKSSVCVML